MLAILKREIKAYFYSPIAYVLIGLFTLVTSIFFYMGNIGSQSANFIGTLSTISFLLIFIIPILTMRILAEDRKNGTEVLLVTSPASISNIVIGKYLAMLFVFLVMTCVTLLYVMVLFMFGSPAVAPLIGGYIGFILLGASLISIGVFASSLTENQVVAVIVSFVFMLIIWVIESIGNSIGGWFATVLNWFSLTSRFSDFSNGILSLSNIIYYLSFISVFIFITIQVIEKRRWSQG